MSDHQLSWIQTDDLQQTSTFSMFRNTPMMSRPLPSMDDVACRTLLTKVYLVVLVTLSTHSFYIVTPQQKVSGEAMQLCLFFLAIIS